MSGALDTINSFDEATKLELSNFLTQEQKKAALQFVMRARHNLLLADTSSINEFLVRCNETCRPQLNASSLRRKDEECLSTCVNRFLDSSVFLVSTLQSKQQGGR